MKAERSVVKESVSKKNRKRQHKNTFIEHETYNVIKNASFSKVTVRKKNENTSLNDVEENIVNSVAPVSIKHSCNGKESFSDNKEEKDGSGCNVDGFSDCDYDVFKPKKKQQNPKIKKKTKHILNNSQLNDDLPSCSPKNKNKRIKLFDQTESNQLIQEECSFSEVASTSVTKSPKNYKNKFEDENKLQTKQENKNIIIKSINEDDQCVTGNMFSSTKIKNKQQKRLEDFGNAIQANYGEINTYEKSPITTLLAAKSPLSCKESNLKIDPEYDVTSSPEMNLSKLFQQTSKVDHEQSLNIKEISVDLDDNINQNGLNSCSSKKKKKINQEEKIFLTLSEVNLKSPKKYYVDDKQRKKKRHSKLENNFNDVTNPNELMEQYSNPLKIFHQTPSVKSDGLHESLKYIGEKNMYKNNRNSKQNLDFSSSENQVLEKHENSFQKSLSEVNLLEFEEIVDNQNKSKTKHVNNKRKNNSKYEEYESILGDYFTPTKSPKSSRRQKHLEDDEKTIQTNYGEQSKTNVRSPITTLMAIKSPLHCKAITPNMKGDPEYDITSPPDLNLSKSFHQTSNVNREHSLSRKERNIDCEFGEELDENNSKSRSSKNKKEKMRLHEISDRGGGGLKKSEKQKIKPCVKPHLKSLDELSITRKKKIKKEKSSNQLVKKENTGDMLGSDSSVFKIQNPSMNHKIISKTKQHSKHLVNDIDIIRARLLKQVLKETKEPKKSTLKKNKSKTEKKSQLLTSNLKTVKELPGKEKFPNKQKIKIDLVTTGKKNKKSKSNKKIHVDDELEKMKKDLLSAALKRLQSNKDDKSVEKSSIKEDNCSTLHHTLHVAKSVKSTVIKPKTVKIDKCIKTFSKLKKSKTKDPLEEITSKMLADALVRTHN